MEEVVPETRVRNAQVRYKERVSGLTTEATVDARGREHAEHDTRENTRHLRKQPRTSMQNVNRRFYTMLRGSEEESIRPDSAEDARLIVDNPPEKPPFPTMVLVLAVIKDALDTAGISGIGLVITLPVSFVISLILFLWMFGKMSGAWWKKKFLQRYLTKRLVFSLIIENIPVVQILPATTILVLMAHYRETQIVKMLNGALEALRGEFPQLLQKSTVR